VMFMEDKPKEILVISGKGGTGKTTLAASFAVLCAPCVLADCDVDAADLYLLVKPEREVSEPFIGGRGPVLDGEACTGCGICVERCRFSALSMDGGTLVHDRFACEGCGLCSRVCPEGAFSMRDQENGVSYISKTPYGPMAHARLHVAEENSGKLVTVVRQKAKLLAQEKRLGTIIIDGPPGIGCPVISSMTGVDFAVVVTEPTFSGLHDLKRVSQLAGQFGVTVAVCVNKYDLNEEITGEIESYCRSSAIDILGRLPYDRAVIESLARGEVAVHSVRSDAARAMRGVWEKVSKKLR
jgi:MinD superfamily P-loop ATPase